MNDHFSSYERLPPRQVDTKSRFRRHLSTYLSYGTAKLGLGELYPFAHWRLYSAPIGINEPFTTYRVYVPDTDSASWVRRPLEASPSFSRKELSYILNHWAREVDDDPADPEALQRRLSGRLPATLPADRTPHDRGLSPAKCRRAVCALPFRHPGRPGPDGAV